VLTFVLWLGVMTLTIPGVIDGSIFKAPCLAPAPALAPPCPETQADESQASSHTAGEKRV
jgi:hypothetical protein